MPAEREYTVIHRLLESIEDPRIDRKKLYPITEICFLMLSGTLCGCKSYNSIVTFGEENIDWLRQYYPYVNGLPSHDTLNRAMELISTEVLENLIFEIGRVNGKDITDLQITVDGKSISRSATIKQTQTKKENGGKQPTHILGAYCDSLGLILGMKTIGNKGAENNTIPVFLDTLYLKGSMVTIDAAGCHTPTTDVIIKKEADYIIALKANQNTLYQSVIKAFEENTSESKDNTIDFVRDKKISRTYETLDANLLPKEISSNWKKLTSIIKVNYVVLTKPTIGKEEEVLEQKVRYYISSAKMDAKKFGKMIRGHWSIENKLHYPLDTLWSEDDSRVRVGNASSNWAVFRRISHSLLNLFKKKHKLKDSLPSVQTRVMYNLNKRNEVLQTLF